MIMAAGRVRESLGIVEAAQAKAAAVYASLRLRGVAPERAAAKTSGQYGAAFTVYTAEPPAIPPDRHVKAWRAWRARIEAYSAAHAAALPPARIAGGSLVAIADKAQERDYRPAAGAPSIADIKGVVIKLTGMSGYHLTGKMRPRYIAWPRQIAMAMCRRWGGWSTPQIGREFGNRDHTTVMHAVEEVHRRLRLRDKFTADLFDKMDAAIASQWPGGTAAEIWWHGTPNVPAAPLSMTKDAVRKRDRLARIKAQKA